MVACRWRRRGGRRQTHNHHSQVFSVLLPWGESLCRGEVGALALCSRSTVFPETVPDLEDLSKAACHSIMTDLFLPHSGLENRIGQFDNHTINYGALAYRGRLLSGQLGPVITRQGVGALWLGVGESGSLAQTTCTSFFATSCLSIRKPGNTSDHRNVRLQHLSFLRNM